MSSEPQPPSGDGDRTFQRVLLCFGLILAILLVVVVVSLRNLSRSVATSDWVNHTHALLSELDGLEPRLSAAEGQLSRYLLTSDQRDHAAYQQRFAELGESVEVVKALVAASPEEKLLFAPVADLLTRRAEFAGQVARLKKSGEAAALQRLLDTDGDNADRADLTRRIERLREKETALLGERDRASFVQAQTTRWTVLSGVVLDFLLLAGAAWLVRDGLAARRRAAQILQRSNEELEAKVAARTAELSKANAQLVTQNLEDRWAKQALEHQNRYNLLIIDSITDAVFVVTKLVNISRMNHAAVHLTGFEPVDLVDRPLSRAVQLAGVEPGRTTYDPLARTLVEGHELRDQAAVVIGKNGQVQPARLSIFPLRDRDKVVGGVVILKASA